MTLAVCVNCGSMKFGALAVCEKCHTSPMTTADSFVYSMVLTDHYFKPDVLEEISNSMLQGGRMPRLSPDQEKEMRQQYLPEYERMKFLFSSGSLRHRDGGVRSEGSLTQSSLGLTGHAKSEFNFWTTALAGLASALPLISLFQKLFDVGLTPLLRDALSFYRQVAYPIVDQLQTLVAYVPWLDFYSLFFHKLFPLDVYRDLTVLSFFFASIGFRVLLRTVIAADTYSDLLEGVATTIGMAVILLICIGLALTMLALALPLVAGIGTVAIKHNRFNLRPIDGNPYWIFLFTLLLASLAAAAFFLTNALLPH